MFNFFKKKVTAKDLESFKETLIEEIKNLLHNNDPKKPGEIVKKAVLSNTTLMVVTNSGNVYNNTNASNTMLNKVLAAETEQEVAALMQPELSDEEVKARREEKLKQEFQQSIQVLIDKGDFELRNGSLYYTDINISLPKIMVEAFIESLADPKAYTALKMFWFWLALNPNPESREDSYKFVTVNDVKITPKGQLALYRSIVSKGNPNKDLVRFISTQFAKIKMMKKSPKNYTVILREGVLSTVKHDRVELGDDVKGNLADLYEKLPEFEENSYTDRHTQTMDIKIGSVYSIPEDQIDRDGSRECSRGLHVASRNYDYGSFGDTPVLVLVNPSKIRAVPHYESSKMRVAEMFIAAVLEYGPNREYMDDGVDLVEMDDLYFNISIEELEQMAKNANISELSEKKLLPELSFKSFEFVKEQLTEARDAISKRTVTMD